MFPQIEIPTVALSLTAILLKFFLYSVYYLRHLISPQFPLRIFTEKTFSICDHAILTPAASICVSEVRLGFFPNTFSSASCPVRLIRCFSVLLLLSSTNIEKMLRNAFLEIVFKWLPLLTFDGSAKRSQNS